MSENLNDLGLTARQSAALDAALAETKFPSEIESTMKRFQKLAEENQVLARADQIKAGREEVTPDE